MKAHIDFETASATDLRKSGLYRYALCSSTRIWGFCWRIGDGAVYEWRPGFPDPVPLLDFIARGGTVVAHNAPFERAIWNYVLRGRYVPHWPELRIAQQECTKARALALSLPADLDTLGHVLSLPNKKDKAGEALMKKMAKPRGVAIDGAHTWWDSAENVERLMNYCAQDVRAEHDADVSLPQLTAAEQVLWQFDQAINERGVRIDVDVVRRAAALVDFAKKKADAQMRKLTGGAVKGVSKVKDLVSWLNGRGIPCASMAKGDVEDIVFRCEVVGDDDAVKAVRLRRAASKTSTAKYGKMLETVCPDGRLRGMLEYHGASTGRWAGRLVQPQNFPRLDYKRDGDTVLYIVSVLSQDMPVQEAYALVDEKTKGKTLEWLAKSLRSMFTAALGRKYVGGDYSNIEGRVNAWLAGEYWKLDAFIAYDIGIGDDLYKLAYARAFNINVSDVTDTQRQIGKVMELALGYQGGVNAFLNMADVYSMDIYALAKAVRGVVPEAEWNRVAAEYAKATDKCGLFENEWTALKILVKRWRAAHPCIVQSWWDYQDAALEAVSTPGQIVSVVGGKVRYLSDGNFLYCCLPSGRVIAYAQPFVEVTEVTRVDKNGDEYKRIEKRVKFWSRDSTTGKWGQSALYGGLQCENIVQAVARDVMVEGMFRLEAAGYWVILTVHDEALSEVGDGFGSADEYQRIMSTLPEWAPGLPLAAAAWEDKRYVK